MAEGLTADGRPGVCKAFALVVFAPSGARVRGPEGALVLFGASQVVAMLTRWSHKSALIKLASLALTEQPATAPFATSPTSTKSSIFIVQRHLEWGLRRLVPWRLRRKTFDTLVQWFGCRGGLLLIRRILIIVAYREHVDRMTAVRYICADDEVD
jgi:hypothetical protein